MPNWNEIKAAVEKNGNVLTVTMEQLRDNLGALSIHLQPEHLAKLDELSKPSLPFPHDFLTYTVNNVQGGTTVNGRPSTVWNLSPQSDKERW